MIPFAQFHSQIMLVENDKLYDAEAGKFGIPCLLVEDSLQNIIVNGSTEEHFKFNPWSIIDTKDRETIKSQLPSALFDISLRIYSSSVHPEYEFPQPNSIDERTNFIYNNLVLGAKYEELERSLGLSRGKLAVYWEKSERERSIINSIKAIYNRKKDLVHSQIKFKDFYQWYSLEPKKCNYCLITQIEIDEMFKRDLIKTKRKKTRGKLLEIERLLPEEPYSNFNNLTLACYWCNNAKSDEFTADEFNSVGKLIGQALRKRLSVHMGL